MSLDIDHIATSDLRPFLTVAELHRVHEVRVSELIANANRLEQQARDARAELNQYRRRITALISEPTAGMALLLQDVRAFHQACDIPVVESPTLAPWERRDLRQKLLVEEVCEYYVAIESSDLVSIADALADIIYVCVGTALEYGIPIDKCWAEVQRSNMAKVDAATGKVTKRADGKVLKPSGWVGPDMAGILGIGT